MKTYSFLEIFNYARAHSPFYRGLYANLVEGDRGADPRMDEVPILDQKLFWEANSAQSNQLLTGTLAGAIVFKSGGTTGNPKFSIYTHEEWSTFTALFGQGMNRQASLAGERVANLFYAGDLYASFLFIHDSIENSRSGAVNFPVSGSASFETILKICADYQIDVLAGVPTTFLNFARYCENQGVVPKSVRKVVFGGESMYPDQRDYIAKVFSGAKISSIGYASVDAGLLGYADESCAPDEHRCFGEATVMEIVDEETGAVIEAVGQPGKLLVTNLTRKLMPIIRYPAGDRAVWVEPARSKDRKFRILGRSEEAARLGPVSLYFEDVAKVLEPYSGAHSIHGFQLVLEHKSGLDECLVRVGTSSGLSAASLAIEIVESLVLARPELKHAQSAGTVGKIRVEFVSIDALDRNPRTGKLKRVIDQRK